MLKSKVKSEKVSQISISQSDLNLDPNPDLKPRRLTQQLKTAVPRVRTRHIPKFGIITYVDATYLIKLPSYT